MWVRRDESHGFGRGVGVTINPWRAGTSAHPGCRVASAASALARSVGPPSTVPPLFPSPRPRPRMLPMKWGELSASTASKMMESKRLRSAVVGYGCDGENGALVWCDAALRRCRSSQFPRPFSHR